ncbi:MAG: prephenate dehydrogenase [Clostridia bacterium]|nr:prephenate dehydrogenase [Clostridia bacterium]
MKIINDVKFLIVGLGLIGGSYAQALTDLGYEVGAVTRSQSSIDYAKEHGLISHGTTEVTREYISQFDVIVFALYPKVFIEWIEKYQEYFKSGALLTDVTGVKGPIVYKIQALLRKDVEFVGAHPMAGREVYGVQNADKTIFRNANYIVTPTENNTKEGIAVCKSLGKILGFKTIAELSPEKHDEMIGFLSQLTHCIAVSLMTCKESEHLVDYTGDSFRDLTRIAKINEDMWSELFLMNKDELLSQMDLFIEKFKELKSSIENEDIDKMKSIMRTSTKRRAFFDKK